jgi:primosomal protein N' (replication factor Y) (superfamily II helicase)
MFIQVRLLQGFKEPLLYRVPDEWVTKPVIGSLVRVPLRNSEVIGAVESVYTVKPTTSFVVKAALKIEQFPVDPHFMPFIRSLAEYYGLDATIFLRRIQQFIAQKENTKELVFDIAHDDSIYQEPLLTAEQQYIVDSIATVIGGNKFSPSLLHGVTGSGKTEVYKALIKDAYNKKKVTVLLLPEVALAVQFTFLLRKQLPSSIPIFGFHSATNVQEKRTLWNYLVHQKPALIVGVHLPVMLPLPHLGLIIVDEEHDTGYQEKKHPKIHTKEAAILRAHRAKIPILLGSATPSIATFYNVRMRGWNLFQLTKRFSGAFPHLQVVSLNDKRRRKHFWISDALYKALQICLEKKEQSILFLNRRGYSFFVQCSSCGHIVSCNNCSVSLTLHDNDLLMCHYCGHARICPKQCLQCKADEKALLKKGVGTQQLVSIVQSLFPNARIARADMDTTIDKKKWQKTLRDFTDGAIDILVGTQTITKGYHFPGVTLVGIVWADLQLHIPLYNASETSLQQIIQVAGRAGRQRIDSSVIVQTLVDHSIFGFIDEQQYTDFIDQELSKRQLVGYPPYIRLSEFELKYTDELVVQSESHACMEFLKQYSKQKDYEVILLGPAKPPVYKIKAIFSRKIYCKSHDASIAQDLYAQVCRQGYKSSLFYTPNPMT